MKTKPIFSLLLVLCLLLSACGATASATEAADTEEAPPIETAAVEADASDMFTNCDADSAYDADECSYIVLNGDSAESDSDAVTISGGTVTITGEGVYVVSGTLSDGTIIVNADSADKIQLVLNGATVHSESFAAIYVLQADKVFVTLAAGSENTLSNGGAYEAIDDNSVDAVVFSKDDLTFNGSGSLTVSATTGHGVVSKDDLVVTDGTYDISCDGHGLSGKDSVRIADGDLTIRAGKDAIEADNADDATLGFVYISGGTFALTAGSDGVSASGYVCIDGGAFTITSGGGVANAPVKAESGWGMMGSSVSATDEDSTSAKGIKAAGDLDIRDGVFSIDACDDAIHTNTSMTILGGTFTIASGDDGMHADVSLCIEAGTIDITQCYEGIESQAIEILGGDIALVSDDDGINAGGGADGSGMNGGWGPDSFSGSSDTYISISGGNIYVNATGDGLDSNGSLYVSGGTVYVCGAAGNGDGSLDCDGTCSITGGTVIGACELSSTPNFGTSSTQGSIMVGTGTQSAGSTITLTDNTGAVLAAWTVDRAFSSVVVSCPALATGETYTLTAGSYSQQITLSSLIYGSGGGMGGMGGGKGGR